MGEDMAAWHSPGGNQPTESGPVAGLSIPQAFQCRTKRRHQAFLKTAGAMKRTLMAQDAIPKRPQEIAMNACIHITAACLAGSLLVSAPTRAAPDTSPRQVVIDCAQPRLPTQREVGDLLGQHNFAQVYASRAALMAEARRICARGPAQMRRVAFESPSAPAAPSTPAPPARHIAGDRRDR
jgi:hypothetical protein